MSAFFIRFLARLFFEYNEIQTFAISFQALILLKRPLLLSKADRKLFGNFFLAP